MQPTNKQQAKLKSVKNLYDSITQARADADARRIVMIGKIESLLDEGVSYPVIAGALGISHQAVQQMVKGPS